MKTAISIGVMTVLSGVGLAAWAQAPVTQPAQTQRTAPQSDRSSQRSPSTAPAHENSAAYSSSLADEAKTETERQHKELHAMDSNSDGLVSRQEYMSYHEYLYDEVEKNSAGMISLADLAGSTTTGSPSDPASRSRGNP